MSPYKKAEFTSADSNSKFSAAAAANSNLTDSEITVSAYALLFQISYHLSPLNTNRALYLSKLPSG